MYKAFLFIILIAVFSGCSKKEDPSNEITTSSGLKYIDLVIGTGPSPQVGQDVTIHYTGTLLDGKKFDSSKDRNTPYKFTIGMGQTLLGWDEGVISMKVGGKRKLIVPPELAYGSTGVRTVIPPNTTVVFEIELLDVKDHR